MRIVAFLPPQDPDRSGVAINVSDAAPVLGNGGTTVGLTHLLYDAADEAARVCIPNEGTRENPPAMRTEPDRTHQVARKHVSVPLTSGRHLSKPKAVVTTRERDPGAILIECTVIARGFEAARHLPCLQIPDLRQFCGSGRVAISRPD